MVWSPIGQAVILSRPARDDGEGRAVPLPRLVGSDLETIERGPAGPGPERLRETAQGLHGLEAVCDRYEWLYRCLVEGSR